MLESVRWILLALPGKSDEEVEGMGRREETEVRRDMKAVEG